MSATNRIVSVLVSVGYALTITTAALFHNHGVDVNSTCDCRAGACSESRARVFTGHEEERSCPAAPVDRSGEHPNCPVCQFLAQKPAPAADIPPPQLATTVEEISTPAPTRLTNVVFFAWQSRAPPSAA